MRRLVPVDLGGSPQPCAVAPSIRQAQSPETMRLLVDQYAQRWPDTALQIGFFHGGTPTSAHVEACQGRPFRLSCNPADLSRDDARRLFDGGCTTVELEAMTFDPHVLRTCNRPYTGHRVRTMASRLREMGIKVGLHLVPGLPGSDVSGALSDVDTLVGDGSPIADFVRIWPAIAFEGSDLAHWAAGGRWEPWDVDLAVDVVGKMVEVLDGASIPVARIGIQPGQDIPVRAVAGPLHPNLRGEIESRRFGVRIRNAMSGVAQGADVTVVIHPKDLSWAKGTSNINGRTTKSRFGLNSLRFVSDAGVERGTVRVDGGCRESN